MSANLPRKVMYVEDEPDIRTIASMTLEAMGQMEVLTCESGAVALEKAADFGPDLILLDVMMPGMDGPTTLKKLRELPEFDQVPVIFMTAKAQPAEIEALRALGATGVIPKPFDPMQLVNQIGDILSANAD